MGLLLILIGYSVYIGIRGFFFSDMIADPIPVFTQLNIAYLFLSVTYLWVVRRKNLFCPELILAIAFFLSSYLFSLIDMSALQNVYYVPERLVMRSMSLATLGWCGFITGGLIGNRKALRTRTKHQKDEYYSNRIRKVTLLLAYVFVAYLLIFERNNYINRYTTGGELTESLNWAIIFITLASYYEFLRLNRAGVGNFISFLRKVNKPYLVLLIFFSVFLTYTGNRSSALQIMIPAFVLYYLFIQRIRFYIISIFIVCGMLLFTFLRDFRSGISTGTGNLLSIEMVGSDFIAANVATPNMVEYIDKNGDTGGENMLMYVLSVIPFAQSIAIELFDLKPVETSSMINTVSIQGFDFQSGQGTNVIGDLYYSFGFIGVILGMMVAGYAFSYLFSRVLYQGDYNKYRVVILLILFGNIIFFVRVEYLYIIRTLSFSVILLYIFGLIFKSQWREKRY